MDAGGRNTAGGVISPLLSNIYLDPLDHWMTERGKEMVRYADDFVILCRGVRKKPLRLTLVQEWTAAAGLQLHPEKTKIVDATQAGGSIFLGIILSGAGNGRARRA